MACYEARHEKFVNTSTSAFTLLSILDPSFEENPLKCIHRMVDIYHMKVRENTVDNKLHDVFRILLCYQYQLRVTKKIEATSDYSNRNLFYNLKNSLLCPGVVDETAKAINDDITVLQIIFYLNIDDINDLFKEALKFIEKLVNDGKKLQDYLPIVEILVDAWRLRRKLEISDRTNDVTTIGLLFDKISSWFQIIDENNSQEWNPFLTLIIQLTSATDFLESLCNLLWDLIIGYRAKQTEKKSLTLLTGIIDNLFSKSAEKLVLVNINNCLNQEVLLLISDNLSSNIQLCRKQAIYVLKRIVEYLKEYSQNIPSEGTDAPLKPPFIFCVDANFNIEELKRNYFLLLESLEEEQADLALPAMSHLDNLVVVSISQESCFSRIWLRCIFTRLLNHSNNAIIKTGLSALLRMDLQTLDDGFIALLIKTLNNELIYEDNSSEPHPLILKELSGLFIKAEQSEINIVSKFIIAASKINWSPIPLFYIFEALGNNKQMTQIIHNVWGAEELTALKVITDKHANSQIKIMRLQTQMNILKCITVHVKAPLDFMPLARILPFIASNNVLERGNDNWKLLTDYLRENIEESNAVKSLFECCKQLLKDDTDSTDIKALAILIVLICDTGNMLLKASVNSISLQQLFMPIVDTYKKPYTDSPQFLKSLQMITSVLELSPQADDPYITSIYGFSQIIFDFIMNSLRSNWPQTYDVARIHIEALSAILNIGGLSVTFAESINNMIDIGNEEVEKMIALVTHDDTPVIRSWYALNILYLINDKGCVSILNKGLPKFISNDTNEQIVSECYGLVAKIYYRCVERHGELPEEFFKEFLTDKLLILAETKSNHAVSSIVATLREIIMKVKDNEEVINDCSETIKNIIDVCWKNLWDLNKTEEFLISGEYLIKLILNANFLEKDEFKQIALNCVNDIVFKTGNTSALRYLLFTQMYILEEDDIVIFRDSILSSFLDVGEFDKRVEIQTCCYIMKEYEINFLDENLKSGLGVYTDVITRAVLVMLIMKMDCSYSEELLKAYVPRLISILEEQKNEKYVGDSNVHRLNHRIMQIFIILENSSLLKDDAVNICDILSKSILSNSDQPSVRFMQEWLLILLHLDYYWIPSMQDRFALETLSKCENRPESLTSFILIIYHVAKKLDGDKQLEYIRKAVTNILPNCFSPIYRVQLYSQVVVSKLFTLLDEISPEQSNEYKIIREAVQESLRHGDLKTDSDKLLNSFYFSVFDPEKNCTLKTIFYELPRLTDISMNEWIKPEIFKSFKKSGIVKLVNFIIDIDEGEESDKTPDSDPSDNEHVIADVQGNVIPPTSELPNSEESVPAPV